MNTSVQIIPFANLALAFIPVFVVAGILYKWTSEGSHTLYAVFRMLVQLLLIGYFLIFIFESDSGWVVMSVLVIMLCTSSWIALRTIKNRRLQLYKKAFYAIIIGGGITLLLITQGVLQLDPWYMPSYMIPLAGMIFAASMTNISLAIERLGLPEEAPRDTTGLEDDPFLEQEMAARQEAMLMGEQEVFDEVTAGIVEEAGKIKVGDGFEADTAMGPLVSEEQFDRVTGLDPPGEVDLVLPGDQVITVDVTEVDLKSLLVHRRKYVLSACHRDPPSQRGVAAVSFPPRYRGVGPSRSSRWRPSSRAPSGAAGLHRTA